MYAKNVGIARLFMFRRRRRSIRSIIPLALSNDVIAQNHGSPRVGAQGLAPYEGVARNMLKQNCKRYQSYAESAVGAAPAIFGSFGPPEISINQGNAAQTLGLKRGDQITVRNRRRLPTN